MLAAIGIVKMLTNFTKGDAEFIQAQAWVRAACVLGILIWGLGFYVFLGDFFLAWQTATLSYLQTAGLNYALMMAIPYLLLKKYEHSRTI